MDKRKNPNDRARIQEEYAKELYQTSGMDAEDEDMINVLVRLIQEQYQGISKSERLSNVTAKILNKPGKNKSGLMKDKRIIVLQPFCTCVLGK